MVPFDYAQGDCQSEKRSRSLNKTTEKRLTNLHDSEN